MSGSISLSMAQRFDRNGAPLNGGKLYFYAANTLTPQLAYKDTGLTLPHPNPITLDAYGNIPEFYLADGSIRVRLTDRTGIVQIDALNVLVIGPSSGGGGGASVDATTIFQTGDVIWLDQSGARAGWARDNGRTMGSATSGASERANADCQNLHAFLWNTYTDAQCPVNGGRGASAAADWAANKWITLPDKRGFIPGGLDDMGNAAAGRFANVPVISGTVTTAGATIGEATHGLTSGELPANIPNSAVSAATSTPTSSPAVVGAANGAFASGGFGGPSGTQNLAISTAVTTAVTINPSGGGSHNNTQRTVLGTFYRKL